MLHVGPLAGGRQDGKWQLYDIVSDPGEVNDLSDANPDVVAEMLKLWDQYCQETGTVWGDDKLPIGERGAKGWQSGPDDLIGGE